MGVAGCLWARYAQFLEIRSSFDLDVCLVISDPFCHGKSLLDHHLGEIYLLHLFQSNYANLKHNMLNCQLMNNSSCFLSHGLFGATSLNLHWRHIQSKSKSCPNFYLSTLTAIPELRLCYFVGELPNLYNQNKNKFHHRITKPRSKNPPGNFIQRCIFWGSR